jgi:tetratricopeptide (TPR) repeat protein
MYSAQIPNIKMEDSDRNKVLGQANFLKCKELHHEKKYAEAEPFGTECLRLYKLVVKKVDHPMLLGVYTLLGSTQAGLQKFNEADVLFNLSVQSLSKSELDSENYIDCLELCWQSFNIKLDPSNSQIQVVVGLAIKYLKLLLESLKRVLDKFKSKNAPPEVIKPVEARLEAVTFNLAIQYFKLGRPDDSIPLLEDSLVIRRKYLGKNDINIGMSLFMIAEANFFLNRRENLVSQFESAYNIFLEIDGKEADQYSNKCFQYIRRLNDENAAASKVESKLKNQSSSSSSPVSSLNSKSLDADDVQGRLSLIDAYVRANDLSKANELLKQTIVICKKNPTLDPAEQIAKLEMKLKRFDDTLHGIMIGECFNEYLAAFKKVDISDVRFAFEFTGVLNNSKNHQILSNADVDKHRMIKMVSITQNSSETGK